MTKHFCDRCAVQLESGFSKIAVWFRTGTLRGIDTDIELCDNCVDIAFGADFVGSCTAELKAKREAAEARKRERLAKKTPTEAPGELEDE